MSASPKPIRHARVPRPVPHRVEEEDSHAWAVSYADMLMVLLSFFVVFFSTEKNGKESVIQTIISSRIIKGLTPLAASAPAVESGSPRPGRTMVAPDWDEVRRALSGVAITTAQQGQSLVLLFPDDLYAKGQSALPNAIGAQLAEVLAKLRKFSDRIELVFVGHTDKSPVKQISGRKIEDNFDLSSARAKAALQSAERTGFPIDRLRMEGDAGFQRASRTLSVRIVAKDGAAERSASKEGGK